jgi:hypothetical protein
VAVLAAVGAVEIVNPVKAAEVDRVLGFRIPQWRKGNWRVNGRQRGGVGCFSLLCGRGRMARRLDQQGRSQCDGAKENRFHRNTFKGR